MRWARANIVPVIASERAHYHRDDVGQNARSIIEAMRLEAARLAAQAEARADPAFAKEAARNTAKWTASVSSQANIDVAHLLGDDDLVDLLSLRSEEFNSLIKSLSQDVHSRIERETLGSIFEGRSNADVAKALQQIDGIGRNRARLIARDQASKLNAAMNEFRQQQAGVTHYKWLGIDDGRERPTHIANNNRIFAWDNPSPVTGHPGHDVNCRCRAAAVLDDAPEDLPEAVQSDPLALSEFFSANLPLIRTVAQTIKQNVLSFAPEDIALRLAQTRELQASIEAAVKAGAIDNSDAERLLVEVFGFKPKESDIENLLGSNVKALFASQRTKYINAVQSRLQLIENQLIHADVGAPETVLNTELVLPKPLDPALKGLKLPPLPGNPGSFDAAIAAARDWLSAAAKAQKVEYAISTDEYGNFLSASTSGKKYTINLPEKLFKKKLKGSDYVSTVVHHNHLTNTSFSSADIKALDKPFFSQLYAHTPDGSTFTIKKTGSIYQYSIESGFKRIIKKVKALVASGDLPASRAEFIATHSAAIGADLYGGGIDYIANLSPALKKVESKYKSLILKLAKEIEPPFSINAVPTWSTPPSISSATKKAIEPEWLKALPLNGLSRTDAFGIAAQAAHVKAVEADQNILDWVRAYTGSGYRTINRWLRTGKGGPTLPGYSVKLSDGVKALDAAFDVQVPSGTTLYRGVKLRSAIAKKIEVGAVISDRGFVSTTLNKEFASSWISTVTTGDNPFVFVIDGNGLRGLDVRSISSVSGEDEVTLARRQAMRVTRIEEYRGLRYVFLEKA